MPGSPSQSTIYRFGAFEVNATTGELRKHGLRIRLQDQPLEVLVSLLERPGELVTREVLVQRLWPDGTIVDFDRGLNAAVARLRQALSDSAEAPVYVETVARRGYRFVAPLNGPSAEGSPERDEASPPQKSRWLAARRNVAAASLLISLLLGAALWLRWPRPRAAALADGPWKVAPLTSAPGIERNPSFSPDGTQVAYEWDRGDGQPHVYVKMAGPGDPIRLTPTTTSDFGPAWSPDGTRIAFVRVLSDSSIGIFVAPALGGAERRVAENPSPDYWFLRQHRRRLAWTADSSHLVVSGPDRPGTGEGLFLVSVASGARRWLTQPSPVSATMGDREPAVSPDGRTLAFARGEANASETIYLLDLSEDLHPRGEPRPLDAVKSGRSHAWTPDGRALLFTPINPSYNFGSGLFIAGLSDSSPPKPIPDAGWGVTIPAVAATGRRLAWGQVTRKLSIWRQGIPVPGQHGSPPERLTPESGQSANPQYSPDGTRIAFASNRSGSTQIWTCASDGSHCAQVTSFIDGLLASAPRWSPDGALLAFDSGRDGRNEIYVVNADGGVPRRLTHGPTPSMIPSWSRDGRWVYFSLQTPGEPEIWKIAASGGNPVRITRGMVAFESLDGQSLLFTRGDRGARLYCSNLDGSGEVALIEGVALRGFAVAADRNYFLKEEPKRQFAIHQLLLASRRSSRVADIAGEPFLGLSLSPDGKYLAYTRTEQLSTSLVLAEPAAR